MSERDQVDLFLWVLYALGPGATTGAGAVTKRPALRYDIAPAALKAADFLPRRTLVNSGPYIPATGHPPYGLALLQPRGA